MSVTVYSTPTCHYCTLVKDFLRKKAIPFQDYDVSRDVSKADEMVRKSNQMGVPVIDVNGTIIVGYNPTGIEKALSR